jgi:hypothetical protein
MNVFALKCNQMNLCIAADGATLILEDDLNIRRRPESAFSTCDAVMRRHSEAIDIMGITEFQRPLEEIRKIYAENGIDGSKPIIT